MKTLPTLETLREMRANDGKGFTKELLESWGVSWPPQAGWARKLEAEILSSRAKTIVVQNEPKAKKEARRARRRKVVDDAKKRKSFSPSPDKRQTFYASWEWKKVRMQAPQLHGHVCQSCGSGPKHGVRIVVDHIKPLGKFWELRLDLNNLQVLCDDCNRGKGDWLHADFRSQDEWQDESDPLMAQFREIMRQ